jgi:8-oxo-dGTP pyrophosphatase MutT (NUDIX family)
MVLLDQGTFDTVNAPVSYIPSFGVICALNPRDGSPIKFLLVQRANTYEFLEFVRGKYDENDTLALTSMFAEMTYEEKSRIFHFDIRELRRYFAYLDADNSSLTTSISAKFNVLKQNKELFDKLIQTKSDNGDTGWEFPKGRRNNKQECAKVCALREFEEETGISQKKIILLPFEPFSETFTGSNTKVYKTTYYFAVCHDVSVQNITRINACDPNQTREVKHIAWLTANEAITLLGYKKNIAHIVTEFEKTLLIESSNIIHETNKLKDFGICQRCENDYYYDLTCY